VRPDQLINRGNNLLATGALAALGLGLITELTQEDELLHKADEIGVIVIAALLVGWYFLGKNRYSRSFVPLAMVTAALVVKVVGLALEFSDTKDVGDDIGVVQVILALLIIVGITLYASRRSTRPDSTPPNK
jgi:hypothetical protein